VSELAEHTDAQLVAGVLAGDREAFAAVYDRYADRLHDFCHSVLRDRDEAADAVQDTFVLVAQRLAQLNDPDRLRPWLYAVARSVALRKVRVRQRVVLDEVEDMADTHPGPDRAAEQVALRDLVWSAAAGLSERDRALLDLHVRQGLDGAELGEAMGVSASHAYVLLTRLRDQVERSLGALLIARQGRKDCIELDALLSDWDGRYSPLMRKRVARHVDSCEVCSDRKRVMVSPFALLAAVPLVAAPLWLRDRVMDQVQLAAYEGDLPAGDGPEAAVVSEAVSEAAGPGAVVPKQRARIAAAAAAVLALLIVAGGVMYWRNSSVPGEPLGLDVPIAPSLQTSTTGPGFSSNPPSSTPSGTTTTTPGQTTTTTVEPADDPGSTTTTTTRRVVPPPPPPPRDTTPPVISNPAASNPRINIADCPEPHNSPVSATVTDNKGVQSVTVTWTGAGTGSATMSGDGSAWSGSIGSFTQPGSVEWTITATDAAGNSTSVSGGKISVSGCPLTG
jgi:RNA polymerase sigma factor (sigma-70 family)